jgi:hypothetical protein
MRGCSKDDYSCRAARCTTLLQARFFACVSGHGIVGESSALRESSLNQDRNCAGLVRGRTWNARLTGRAGKAPLCEISRLIGPQY